MSQHYLIDLYGNPIANAAILDIISTSTGTSPLAGNFVVRVPDGLSVQKPTDLADLLVKKYAATLAYYSFFTRIAYDDLLDTAGIDFGAVLVPPLAGMFGDRSNIRVNSGHYVQSVMVPLAGAIATQALITWETFLVSQTDIETSTVERTYQEVLAEPATSTCLVSFNNGVSWLAVTDGMVLNIPAPDQGNQFIVRFGAVPPNNLNFGSWALLY